MNKHGYKNNSAVCIKIILVSVLLFVPLFMSCPPKNSSQNNSAKDPFLLIYLMYNPTLKIDTSENVVEKNISYKDFDKKEIDYGDADPGTLSYYIYLFKNGVFYGLERAKTKDGSLLERYKEAEIIRNKNGRVTNINRYTSEKQNRPYDQETYTRDNNAIIAYGGLSKGRAGAVIVEEDDRILYFRDYKDYTESPDLPYWIIEFVNDDVIKIEYDYFNHEMYSRHYFINGILMKIEYFNGTIQTRTDTYTVVSGIGEIIKTNAENEVIERNFLERRINDAGFLEYEAVRYPSGRGYEFILTKDTFKREIE